MRKSMALIVLGLLLVSMVPLAFAQDARIEVRDQVRERVQELREDRARLMEVREQARERVADAQETYRERKEDLRRLREECRNSTSDECNDLREDAKAHTKEFLLSAADRMLGVLDNLLVRIENARMTEENKADLTARVETKIAAVQAAREKIEALTDESTREEFNDAAEALRLAWSGADEGAQSVRELVREGVAHVAVERFGGVLVQAERLTARLEQIKERLGASDVDTSGFDAELASAEAKLEELKVALDANDMPAAAQLIREVKQSLADARRELADILQDLKQNYRDAAAEIRRSAREANADRASAADDEDDSLDDDGADDSTDDESDSTNDDTADADNSTQRSE